MNLADPASSPSSFIVALVLILGGGALALLLARRAPLASGAAVVGVALGAIFGEWAAFHVLLRGDSGALTLPWSIPHGQIHIAIDPLSAFFLVPIFALGAITAVYGREYLGKTRATAAAWPAFNVLVASMAVVVVARHAVLFLFAWEVMSLSAYVLVTLEHSQREVQRAGWVYLIATHIGTAFLIAMFLLLGRQAHGFDFDAAQNVLPRAPGAGSYGLLFGLALVGFGVKSGFVPLHVWLPEAHAASPSHVSALMSGVLIKMGLYGVLRVILLLGRPPGWCGPLLMIVGLSGALLGIALALYQRDMKRALAYSSVENMGLITLGVGTGLWGLTSERPQVAALGMTGALLHVWNHGLMKGLMFLGAGSVLHGCHTKDLEQLGGVMKRMPRTGAAMVLGAVALAGLPPLNGFVSEWLLYLALIDGAIARGGASGVTALLAVGLVALVGGLAMLCFVRIIGVALLGEPRSEAARAAHESPPGMTWPLAVLALGSVGIALAPHAVVNASARAVRQMLGAEGDAGDAAMGDVSLSGIGLANAALGGILVLGLVLARAMMRGRPTAEGSTWDCGYARPSARMQYTARSFAELMSERLLPKRLRARVTVERPATVLFPAPGKLTSECTDPLTRDVYEPLLTRWGDRFARLRWLQQGLLHVYLVYILIATLLALGWSSLLTWSGR